MTQPRLCPDCLSGPTGIDGHANLLLHVQASSLGGQRATFHCEICGATWLRSYAGSGGFGWQLEHTPS